MYAFHHAPAGNNVGCAPDTSGVANSGDRPRSADWQSVGMGIALHGGTYPLIAASCLLLASACYVAFAGEPITSLAAASTFWSALSLMALGLPFLVFSCFLCSTLIAVPLVSVAEWLSGHTRLRVAVTSVRAIGLGLVTTTWAMLVYLALGWSASL